MKILAKPDLAGQMIRWVVELSKFQIQYQPRGAIKSQALTDFAAELSLPPRLTLPQWTLHVDGSSNSKSCGAGVVFEGPECILLVQALEFYFKTSNNQVEYETILVGLNLAHDMETHQLICIIDFELVVRQLKGEFEVKESQLQKYYHLVRNLMSKLKNVQIEHIHREHSSRANMLSRLAIVKKKGLHRSIIYVNLKNPSVNTNECMATDKKRNYRTPIKQFLEKSESGAQEEKTMRQEATRLILISFDLYRRGYTQPLLKCIL